MAAIEILNDLYILSRRKGSSEIDLRSMDSFEKIKFLAQQKPSFGLKKDSNDENKIIYFPVLGDYVFYFKPEGGYVYENKSGAIFRANETYTKLSSIYVGAINFLSKVRSHIDNHKPGTLKNSIF